MLVNAVDRKRMIMKIRAIERERQKERVSE